jgi:hypothetical protein
VHLPMKSDADILQQAAARAEGLEGSKVRPGWYVRATCCACSCPIRRP